MKAYIVKRYLIEYYDIHAKNIKEARKLIPDTHDPYRIDVLKEIVVKK